MKLVYKYSVPYLVTKHKVHSQICIRVQISAYMQIYSRLHTYAKFAPDATS